MPLRTFHVRCDRKFHLKGIPNSSSDIRESILVCVAKYVKNIPVKFKVVFHDEMYALIANLIFWRQKYKCIVLKHIVVLLDKKDV